jgi:hypothetical protein
VGTGCAGSAGTPILSSAQLPWLGDSFDLTLDRLPAKRPAFLTLGLSNTMLGTTKLPLDLATSGMPSCKLFTSIEGFYPVSNAGTSTTFRLLIPNDPGLIGLRFYNQGFVVDPKVNTRGITASNATEALIGAR